MLWPSQGRLIDLTTGCLALGRGPFRRACSQRPFDQTADRLCAPRVRYAECFHRVRIRHDGVALKHSQPECRRRNVMVPPRVVGAKTMQRSMTGRVWSWLVSSNPASPRPPRNAVHTAIVPTERDDGRRSRTRPVIDLQIYSFSSLRSGSRRDLALWRSGRSVYGIRRSGRIQRGLAASARRKGPICVPGS